jgi:hypothetical protein
MKKWIVLSVIIIIIVVSVIIYISVAGKADSKQNPRTQVKSGAKGKPPEQTSTADESSSMISEDSSNADFWAGTGIADQKETVKKHTALYCKLTHPFNKVKHDACIEQLA